MDNKKIGKLIAKLRNEKGLTQQQLGDKVGVGFRAVSKWERGITLPDIGIINELSKILGISTDELLLGELKEPEIKVIRKEESKHKNRTSLKILITIIISIITIIITTLIYQNNKTYTYTIQSNSDEYYITGQATFKGNELSIMINQLYFKNKEFASTMIKNYEYYMYLNDEMLFGYGYHPDGIYVEKIQTINNFSESFRINYIGKAEIRSNELLKNNIKLELNFINQKNQEISKELELFFQDKPSK